MGNPNTKDDGQALRRAGSAGQPGSAHRAPGGAARSAGVRHDRPPQRRRGRRSERPDGAVGSRRLARQRPAERPRQHVGRRHRRLVRRRRSRPLRHRRRRRRSRRRHRPRQHRHDRSRRRHRHRPGLRQRPRPPRRRAPDQAPRQLRQGATQVNGRLPPEVIQRIVRQNFGRFRLCYENGLRNNPNLQGRVSVQVRHRPRRRRLDSVSDGGSDLPDQRRRLVRRPRLRTTSRSRSPKAASSRSSTRSCSTPATDRFFNFGGCRSVAQDSA